MRQSSKSSLLDKNDLNFVREAIENGVTVFVALNPAEYALNWSLMNMAPAALANALMKAEARGMEKAREKDSWLKWIAVLGFASVLVAIAFYIIVRAIESGKVVIGV
jgi:hypothetical protein